jgi:hypothetical protein
MYRPGSKCTEQIQNVKDRLKMYRTGSKCTEEAQNV